MPRSSEHLTPIYGIARGLCIGACMWAPFIIGIGWAIAFGTAASIQMEKRHSENFSSYRTANGGVR